MKSLTIDLNTKTMVAKLNAIAKHAKALADELCDIDNPIRFDKTKEKNDSDGYKRSCWICGNPIE